MAEISNISKETLRLQLKWQEDFWIIKLKTFYSQGTKPRTEWCLKSNKQIFSSFNSHLLQLGRKRNHYDISPNIWHQVKSFVTTCFSNENKFPWKPSQPKLVWKTDFSLTFNPIFTVIYNVCVYIYIYTHINKWN